MCWDEFENNLNTSFINYNRLNKCDVQSNEMNLCMLMHKVQADLLTHTKVSISLELLKLPITLTYVQALSTFQNKVNHKFSP